MKLNYLITAGPTREYIDPVRFISNASSGKMGYAIAEEAASKGHNVVLVSGPVSLPRLAKVKVVPVVSAKEMFDAVKKYFSNADILIGAAAVADYAPVKFSKKKIKKNAKDAFIKLMPTKDILGYFGSIKNGRVIAGFALESNNLIKEAKRKLKTKNLDIITANYPENIGGDKGSVWLINKNGDITALKNMPKKRIAERIINETIKTHKLDKAG